MTAPIREVVHDETPEATLLCPPVVHTSESSPAFGGQKIKAQMDNPFGMEKWELP